MSDAARNKTWSTSASPKGVVVDKRTVTATYELACNRVDEGVTLHCPLVLHRNQTGWRAQVDFDSLPEAASPAQSVAQLASWLEQMAAVLRDHPQAFSAINLEKL